MSTRSTTHFTYGGKTPEAIIYRHSDGYPSGAGTDLLRFFDECAELEGTMYGPRFNDPSYLAAKYVVFLADMFNVDYNGKRDAGGNYPKPASKLDFGSLGVMRADPGDIEYRYVVNCKALVNGRPTLICYKVSGTWDGEKQRERPASQWTLTETPIPPPEAQ